jgi:hypothetical protein
MSEADSSKSLELELKEELKVLSTLSRFFRDGTSAEKLYSSLRTKTLLTPAEKSAVSLDSLSILLKIQSSNILDIVLQALSLKEKISQHYLGSANGNSEAIVRQKFHQCTSQLVQLATKEFANIHLNSTAVLSMSLLVCKLDSRDIDFLASSSVDRLLEAGWNVLHKHVQKQIANSQPLQPFVSKCLDMYAKLVSGYLDQIFAAGKAANPLFSKTVVQAAFKVLSAACNLLQSPADINVCSCLKNVFSTILSSIASASSGTSAVQTYLFAQEGKDLWWCIACSNLEESWRLEALSLIRKVVQEELCSDSDLKEVIGRTLGLVVKSSPEFSILRGSDEKDTGCPNVTIQSECLGLLSSLMQSNRAVAVESLTAGLKEPATNIRFFASLLAFGGSLEAKNRKFVKSWDSSIALPSRDVRETLFVCAKGALLKTFMQNCDLLISTDEDLAELVVSTRLVKVFWELLPEWRDLIKADSDVLPLLIKISLEPTPIPFLHTARKQPNARDLRFTTGAATIVSDGREASLEKEELVLLSPSISAGRHYIEFLMVSQVVITELLYFVDSVRKGAVSSNNTF